MLKNSSFSCMLAAGNLFLVSPLLQAQASAQFDLPENAQEDPSSPSSEGKDARNIEEVVVSARKREERLIDVPVAANVMSADMLNRYATNSFESVSSQVPQVMFSKGLSGNGANVSIRGIGSNTTGDDSIEQAVSFSIDGVSSARGRLISQGLFDLNNVQVLKGPQALYFGKNSPGGVIVVESKGPTDIFEGYIASGYEFSARERRLEGAVGGPITDTLGVRLALFSTDMKDGYVKNVAGPIASATSPVAFDQANGINLPGRPYRWGPGSEQLAGRFTAVYTPNDAFDATFKLLASKYEDRGETSTIVDTSCPVGSPGSLQIDLGAINFTGNPGIAADPYSRCGKVREQSLGAVAPEIAATILGSNGGVPFLETNTYLSSLTMNYRAGAILLTSVTGYYRGETAGFAVYDNTAYALISSTNESNSTSWTQELRAASSFDGPVNLSVGAFYSNDKKDYPYRSSLVRASDPIAGGNIFTAAGNSKNKGSSYSAFGELTWSVTPDIELAGGARYTHEEKSADLLNSYVQPGLVSLLPLTLPAGQLVAGRLSENNVSPQVTVTWHPQSNINLFAGYRTGFKSGGIANPGLIPQTATAQNIVFKSEEVEGYEAGVKFQTNDRRWSGDVVAYHYLYEGLQVSAFDVITNTLFIKNAGAAETDGVEGNINFKPTKEITLRGSAGYNRARYKDFENAACWGGQTVAEGCSGGAQDLSGERVPRAPSWTTSLGVSWDHEISSSLAIGATLDGRYSSGYFTSSGNSPYSYQDAYQLLDMSVRVRAPDDHWEIALVGRNITDEYYVTFSTDKPLAVAPGSTYGILGLPRTVTLQGTYRY